MSPQDESQDNDLHVDDGPISSFNEGAMSQVTADGMTIGCC